MTDLTRTPDHPRAGQVALVTGGSSDLGFAIALAPGPFRTPLNEGVDDDPQVRRFLEHEVPAGRWGDPSELVPAAMLLTSPDAGFLTGAVLPVDGGWTAH